MWGDRSTKLHLKVSCFFHEITSTKAANGNLTLEHCRTVKDHFVTVIGSHIGSIIDCGVVFKLERFSYLSSQSFGLGSPIGLGYLSLVLSLRADA